MATQLRLVDPPPAASPARKSRTRTTSSTSRSASSTPPARGARLGGRTVKGSTRRPAHWGDWQLDARTRQVGRQGIAAARAALQEAADAASLPRAS